MRTLLQSTGINSGKGTAEIAGTSSSSGATGASKPSKRPRDDDDNTSPSAGADGSKRARPGQQQSTTGAPSSAPNKVAGNMELTDVSLLSIVQAQPGGRATFRTLAAPFTKSMKRLNKKLKGSGDQKFLSYVKRLLRKEEDPALGVVYMVK